MRNIFSRLNFFIGFIVILLIHTTINAQENPLEGRWDLTVDMGGGRLAPSWLEVRHSGEKNLIGRFVSDGGSARPVSQVFFDGIKLNFTIPAQWDHTENNLVVEGELVGDQLKGTMVVPYGQKYTWTGVRAPRLNSLREVTWGTPIKLLNNTDLTGWQVMGKKNQWKNINGVLTSPASGDNIKTTSTYDDFKLHIEFRYPQGSNSGVYLRGRYEIQIEDNQGKEPQSVYLGGIYGFIDPWVNAAKAAGEWQSYDVTLVGRMVTVVANGKTIIFKQEIPGITGGAINSDEGAPGPIMLQGDHGPIEYRNIIITPAKK
ncbi:MAG: DUF1080 domain-containing protein [Chitinophagia bacterium]